MSGIPRLSHLLETSVYVRDLDRAQAFYQDVFGFELFLRDERMAGLAIPGASILLLFLRGASNAPTPTDGGGDIPAHDGGGSVHLCFAIPLGELAAWEAHLDAKAITAESRITWPRGGVSLYVRDPDDSLVELATPGLWPSW
ncbi:VOC family protein [Lichenicoccus sp.]|uniref:VOC family protein n=1 Tax=Lichenicoccus sp. TaxID=2781899 RepID=UPI003D12E745